MEVDLSWDNLICSNTGFKDIQYSEEAQMVKLDLAMFGCSFGPFGLLPQFQEDVTSGTGRSRAQLFRWKNT